MKHPQMYRCPSAGRFCIALALIATLSLTGLVAAETVAKVTDRPNIIFILADDLGWADLGCYGNDYHQTPNLDRLAESGMRFTDAYAASSVCSPTRSSIITGKYPANNDLTLWLNGRSPGHAPLLDAPTATEVALEEFTVAEALKAVGYRTASVGKWHLGGEPFFPQHQGFDLNVAGTHNGSPAGGYFLPNAMKLDDQKPGEYLTDKLTDEAMKFIESAVAGPFFLYLPYHSVHTPIQGKKELVELYKERAKPGQKNFNPTYAAMVHSLDENVGRVMDKLDELKIADNTVVFFFSDNGGYHRVTSNAPLRAGKGYSYEGGHREPLIVRYPAKIKAGTTCSEPVISVDFYPTILDMANAKGDERQNAVLDGESIVPLLEGGETIERTDDALYWHYPHYSPQGGKPSGAVRVGPWKLLEFFEDGHVELYNLADDLGEQNDLSEAQPEKTKELHERLKAWRQRMDAKMPRPNPNAGRRGARPPARTTPAFKPTEKFEGFDTLKDVQIEKAEDGCRLTSNVHDDGRQKTGIALMKLDEPITDPATFSLKMESWNGAPANGFFVFGDQPVEAKLVKAGVFIGGNYAAVYEGAYPSSDIARIELPLEAAKPYILNVVVDPAARTVTLTIGDRQIEKKLTQPIESINYIGFGLITTQTTFDPIEIEK